MSNISYIDYEMADGSVVKLSLGMGQLVKLRNKDKETYANVSKLLFHPESIDDLFNIAQLVYGGYACANDAVESFDEFLESMNPDVDINSKAVLELTGWGKKLASMKPSPKPLGKSTKTK